MKCKQYTTFQANGEGYTYEKQVNVTNEGDEKTQLESNVVNLHPKITYQTIEGFGGAMTESSAYLFSRMEEETRKKALSCYFGEDGIGTHFVRTHIDSCDYSLEEYAAVEDPLADKELSTFSLKRDKMYIIPMLKEAIKMSKDPLSVLLSPWSPPGSLKTKPEAKENDGAVYGALFGMDYAESTSGRCNGGSLKPEYYGLWAKYLVKFVQAYLEEGIPVTMLSIQNEASAATNWDSCVWTAQEEKIFLKEYLYPEMKAAGLTEKVGIYFWDHNKERVVERALEMLDEETYNMLEGIAFHWYSGDHFEAISILQEKYPDKVLMMSECCGLHIPGKAGLDLPFMSASFRTAESVEYEDAVNYAHDIIGNLNAGMNRWIDWNLIVDQNGGPRHVPMGFTAGMIADEQGGFRTNLTYHYIAHFSKYIKPGAKRIGHSRYSDSFEMTAACNPDGSIIAVFLNKGDDDTGCAIRINGKVIRIQTPAHTISTVCIEE
ncbi:glycoside hydrolase [Lachnospiraceae bacterium OttesenSCG-928-D06]|nr:glycoside hydrolase [Lachnospiraceae bacterium OttesenSCG-928-D06]